MVTPGMSDGRMFTDYSSNCQYNKSLMKDFATPTNNEYRMHLQSKADTIMKEFAKRCKDNCELHLKDQKN